MYLQPGTEGTQLSTVHQSHEERSQWSWDHQETLGTHAMLASFRWHSNFASSVVLEVKAMDIQVESQTQCAWWQASQKHPLLGDLLSSHQMVFNQIVSHRCSNQRMENKTSQVCLGIPSGWHRDKRTVHGHLSLWLQFGRHVLVRILWDDLLAKVIKPTEDEIRQFEQAILSKYPALKRCWGGGAMDGGLQLWLEKAGDEGTQNNFYNGWTHNHYIANLFLFSPSGRIQACYINCPGTFHDSTMANMNKIYDLIDNLCLIWKWVQRLSLTPPSLLIITNQCTSPTRTTLTTVARCISPQPFTNRQLQSGVSRMGHAWSVGFISMPQRLSFVWRERWVKGYPWDDLIAL